MNLKKSMPVNVHPEFAHAEKEYLAAERLEDKIKTLEKLISFAPSHKGAENLRADLKNRLKRLKEKQEKGKTSGKSTAVKIKKESMQVALLGFANSGKSTFLKAITNKSPSISEHKFTTKIPEVGMTTFEGASIQIVDVPAADSEFFDQGIINTADVVALVITNLNEIIELEKYKTRAIGKELIIFNKIDQLTANEKRKIEAQLSSKKKKFVLVSAKEKENLEECKEKIFQLLNRIRVYTKEPGKEKSPRPIILEPNETVRDVAEKILKGFSQRVIETKIWGPSSKFPGQKVGLQHKLKDKDVVEFKTK